MKNIYFLRHGESKWNILNKIQGSQDSELTEKGKDQGYKAAKNLKEKEITSIYSSNLKRAKLTSEIVGKELGINPVIKEELREMCYGIIEGKTEEKVKNNYLKEYKIWLENPEKFHIEGSETLIDVQKRGMTTINQILEEDKSENLLIVAHETIITTVILGLLGIELDNYKNFSLSNTGITHISIGKNNIMRKFNDISHLEK